MEGFEQAPFTALDSLKNQAEALKKKIESLQRRVLMVRKIQGGMTDDELENARKDLLGKLEDNKENFEDTELQRLEALVHQRIDERKGVVQEAKDDPELKELERMLIKQMHEKEEKLLVLQEKIQEESN